MHQLKWKSNEWFISVNFKSWLLTWGQEWHLLLGTINSIDFDAIFWAAMWILYILLNLWYPPQKKQDILYPSDWNPGCRTFSAKTRTITGKLGQFILAGLQCYSADTLEKFEKQTNKKRSMKLITLSRHNGIIDGTGYLLKMHLGSYGSHLKMD